MTGQTASYLSEVVVDVVDDLRDVVDYMLDEVVRQKGKQNPVGRELFDYWKDVGEGLPE